MSIASAGIAALSWLWYDHFHGISCGAGEPPIMGNDGTFVGVKSASLSGPGSRRQEARAVPKRKSMRERKVIEFQPIRPRRVFEEICDRIRAELAAGTLRPGDKLPPERELAEQFGVSRTAVREALRTLEIAGLVRLQKGAKGGAFIMDGTQSVRQSLQDLINLGRLSLDDLTEARLLIQDVIVRLACIRATQEDFLALERDIDRTEELTAAGRLRERLEYSIEFYKILAAATRNDVLSILIDSLTHILRLVIARVGPDPRMDLVEVRRRFMKHLRARDADRASAEMSEHLGRLHEHLVRAERQRGQVHMPRYGAGFPLAGAASIAHAKRKRRASPTP
jgi:GntR family transcriptional regulator, transcriptional repressor for pyruvate dehydrogenase complex